MSGTIIVICLVSSFDITRAMQRQRFDGVFEIKNLDYYIPYFMLIFYTSEVINSSIATEHVEHGTCFWPCAAA